MEGNQMKMREALEFIKLASDDYEKYGNTKAGALDVIYEKACAALTKPPRNCDVGTAEEQYKRFQDFCLYNSFMGVCSEHCPLYKPSIGSYQNTGRAICFPAWAQMPYIKEGDGK